MPTQKFSFKSPQGHSLSARLDLPDGPVIASALFAHCFTCSKDIPAARRISQRLASQGIAVLRFDFTGLGHSQGEFSNTGFSTNLEDLKAAAQEMLQQGYRPDILIGHSLGGAAVVAAAADIPEATAVVTIGAPFKPDHVTRNFSAQKTEISKKGEAEVCLGGRPFMISQRFITDIAQHKLDSALKSLGKALLVLHAPRDATVSIDNAAAIFTAAKHPKSFVTLDDADHLISDPKDAEYAAEVIASWVTRYLDFHAPAPPPGAPEGITRISEADPGGFLQDIMSGPDHHSLADEPEAYGGTNKGMSPYAFVSAGLGACTSMTLRMYARRKGWPLEHISVDVSHHKVHAQDARENEAQKIDLFQRIIKLRGPLNADQKQKLLEIADKCPVHLTLERSNHIETSLVD